MLVALWADPVGAKTYTTLNHLDQQEGVTSVSSVHIRAYLLVSARMMGALLILSTLGLIGKSRQRRVEVWQDYKILLHCHCFCGYY